MVILWNNKWVGEQEAVIPLQSEAVMYGLGAFETLRVNANGDIIALKEHIARLSQSITAIGMPIKVDNKRLEEMAQRVADKGKNGRQKMRIMVVPEGVMISSEPLIIDETIYKGVSLKSVVQNRPLPHVKSLSYLECLLAYREARTLGYFEALMVDASGMVYEGSRSNIFWFENDTLCTRSSGVLPGITRQLVIDYSPYNVSFSEISVSELGTRSEVFITSSTLGIVPVKRIDETHIPLEMNSRTESLWQLLQKSVYL